MDYQSSITVDRVIEVLAAFVTPFIEGGQVVRAQVNRVPQPTPPCAVLTELNQIDLTVPHTDYDDTKAIVGNSTKINVQIDFYGDKAGDYCKTVKNAFRSQWGYSNFPIDVKPLYTDDGIQAPLITGEQQYASRWILTVAMQYNPTVQMPQQSATEAVVTEIYNLP